MHADMQAATLIIPLLLGEDADGFYLLTEVFEVKINLSSFCCKAYTFLLIKLLRICYPIGRICMHIDVMENEFLQVFLSKKVAMIYEYIHVKEIQFDC
jgi:hypothetical protein